MDWRGIGTRLAPDWQSIGGGSAELAENGLATDCRWIGIGVEMDWQWIGNGLTSDWWGSAAAHIFELAPD